MVLGVNVLRGGENMNESVTSSNDVSFESPSAMYSVYRTFSSWVLAIIPY